VIRKLAAVGLLGAGAALAQSAFTVDELMRDLAATGASTTAFVETRHSGALRTPLVVTGELRYTPPARLERSVRSPVEERYVVAGDTFTIERKGGAPRTVSLASLPALGAFLECIRATLRGDLATLRRFYRVEIAGESAAWTLVLLPSDPEMADLVSVIRITGTRGRLTGMEVVEAGGDRVVTRFGEGAR
jgi:hypothetical protein